MGIKRTNNKTILGYAYTVLATIWCVYSWYHEASQLAADATALEKLMADPPIYLPYLLAAMGVIFIAVLCWDKGENPETSNEDQIIKKSELTDAFGKPLLASQDLEGWSELEEITLLQAACLFAGISPPEDGSVPDAAKPKLEKLKQLMRDKKLTSFAVDLSITEKYSKKLSQIASGTKENIRSDARVLVSELMGAIEPVKGTPQFLLGHGNNEPNSRYITLDDAIRYIANESMFGQSLDQEGALFSVLVGDAIHSALANNEIVARGRHFHVLKGGVGRAPLHPKKDVPSEFWDEHQVNAWWALNGQGQDVTGKSVENAVMPNRQLNPDDRQYHGLYDIDLDHSIVKSLWQKAE